MAGRAGKVILGVGTDLVLIERVAAMHARHGIRMVQRMLTPAEFGDFGAAGDKGRFLAKRFAAKEAFAKAAGTGLRAPLHLAAIGVGHDALGRPELLFSSAVRDWLAQRGVARAHLSLSDERGHALAFVVLES